MGDPCQRMFADMQIGGYCWVSLRGMCYAPNPFMWRRSRVHDCAGASGMTINSLDVTVTLKRKDIAIARLLVYYRSPFGIIATIIGIVLGAIQIMAIVQGRSSGSSTPAIMLPLILVFLLPLGVAFGGLFGAAVSKWLTDVRYSFDDAGFRASVPDVTARFAWTEVKASLQTGKYVVLSLPSALHILPVARLESGVERELRDLVRNKVTPSPKK